VAKRKKRESRTLVTRGATNKADTSAGTEIASYWLVLDAKLKSIFGVFSWGKEKSRPGGKP